MRHCDLADQLGFLLADRLEPAQRPAELVPRGGVIDGELDVPLCRTRDEGGLAEGTTGTGLLNHPLGQRAGPLRRHLDIDQHQVVPGFTGQVRPFLHRALRVVERQRDRTVWSGGDDQDLLHRTGPGDVGQGAVDDNRAIAAFGPERPRGTGHVRVGERHERAEHPLRTDHQNLASHQYNTDARNAPRGS